MGFSLIEIHRLKSVEEIESIIMNPEILLKTQQTGEAIAKIDVQNDCHAGFFVDGLLVGVGSFISTSSIAASFHPSLLKEYRGLHLEFAARCIKWLLREYPHCEKVNVSIPANRRDLIIYAKKMGFINEGVDRLSIRYECGIMDRILMGVTRQEFLGEVCQ